MILADAIGEITGPLTGGFTVYLSGFSTSSTIVGFIILGYAFLYFIFSGYCKSFCKRRKKHVDSIKYSLLDFGREEVHISKAETELN